MEGLTVMEIFTLVSVALNALAAVFAPLVAKKLGDKTRKLDVTENALGTVATGLRVVERAVEDNKELLNRTGAGNKIANTIRTYGPAAKELVDTARQVAAQVRRAGEPGVDDNVSRHAPSAGSP